MTFTSVPSRQPAQPVDRLGRYHLFAPLAEGGLGTVHLAVAANEPRKLLALKILRPELSEDAEFLARFQAEARRALSLSHPSIVPTLDVGCEDGRHFVVSEFVAGPTLRDLLERTAGDPRVPLTLQLQWLCEVLSALQAAHEAGVPLHGRLGPHNVFVTYQGQIKLADFGSCGRGKFAYAAPELLAGFAADARADVFSAGVMLWEMATGRAFAPHELNEETLRARTTGGEPRLALAAPLLSPELALICDRALQVDAGARYPSAEAFRLELSRFLRSRGELAELGAIGELVRALFAEERAGMQELVRAQLKRLSPLDDMEHSAGSAPSTVRRTTPIAGVFEASGVERGWFDARRARSAAQAPSAPERTAATQVSAILRAGAIARARRRRRTRRLGWLLGAAGLAFAAAFVWMKDRLEPGVAPPAAARVQETKLNPVSAVPETAPAVSTGLVEEEKKPSPRRARHNGERETGTRPVGAANDGHKPRVATQAGPVALPPPAAPAAPLPTLPEPEPVLKPAGPAAPTRPLEIGDDLRVRRRAHPRPIEHDNPFH